MQIISFVYNQIVDFPQNKFEIKAVITKTFLDDVKNIFFTSHVIHHSHVTGKIIVYAHDFCNKKTRFLQSKHNSCLCTQLFSFDFFFVVKDITLCVWRTKQLNISRLNLTNVQYAKLVCKLNSLIQSNITNGLYFL